MRRRKRSPGGSGGASPTLWSSLQAALDGGLTDMRAALHEDMRALHLEVLREFEAQRLEMRALLDDTRAESARLRDENECLRQENARLRGPLRALG